MFQIYYDLFSVEDESEFEGIHINASYSKVIQSLEEKLVLKEFGQIKLTELEQIAAIQRQKALNTYNAEKAEEMRRRHG